MQQLSILLFVIFFFIACVDKNMFLSAEETPEITPSLLLESVLNRDMSGIERALEAGESIDLVNDNGWSAARFAVSLYDLDMLQALIDAKIDLNNGDNDGVTPLMAAAASVSNDIFLMALVPAI